MTRGGMSGAGAGVASRAACAISSAPSARSKSRTSSRIPSSENQDGSVPCAGGTGLEGSTLPRLAPINEVHVGSRGGASPGPRAHRPARRSGTGARRCPRERRPRRATSAAAAASPPDSTLSQRPPIASCRPICPCGPIPNEVAGLRALLLGQDRTPVPGIGRERHPGVHRERPLDHRRLGGFARDHAGEAVEPQRLPGHASTSLKPPDADSAVSKRHQAAGAGSCAKAPVAAAHRATRHEAAARRRTLVIVRLLSQLRSGSCRSRAGAPPRRPRSARP